MKRITLYLVITGTQETAFSSTCSHRREDTTKQTFKPKH